MKRKTAYLGLFAAVAIIFGYVESLVPVFTGIPGIKLGLANLAVLFYTGPIFCKRSGSRVRCQNPGDRIYVWKSVQYFV